MSEHIEGSEEPEGGVIAGATDAAKFLAWQLVSYPLMAREHTHVHGATVLTEVKGRRFVIIVAELPS